MLIKLLKFYDLLITELKSKIQKNENRKHGIYEQIKQICIVKHVYTSEKVLLQVLTKPSNMLNVRCIFHISNISNHFCTFKFDINNTKCNCISCVSYPLVERHNCGSVNEIWKLRQMGRFSASNCEIYIIHVLHLALIYIHLANAFIQSHFNKGPQKAWLQMTSKVHDHGHTHGPVFNMHKKNCEITG